MKPVPFAYHRAADPADARTAAAAAGAPAFSAGSQSLGPMLNLRLARPDLVIDVADLPELRRVEERADAVLIGAAITHAEIEDGEVPDPTPGWMRAAAANIAHRAVRNRGTIGGSLAHADPAADWPIVMLGLGASVHLDGAEGRRTVPIEAFITGPFATTRAAGELIAAVEVPRPAEGARWGYWKFMRQVGEFAKASAVVLDDPATGRRRAALGALGDKPRLLADPDGLVEGRLSPADAVAAALHSRAPRDRALHVAALSRALAALGHRDTA